MKTNFCHYCAVCGFLNPGHRSKETRCQSCNRSTYIQCPECNELLLGRQFRCSHCQEQFTWHESKAISYRRDSKPSDCDLRLTKLPTKAATALCNWLNDKKKTTYVIRLLPALDSHQIVELANFKGDLHLPDVRTLIPADHEIEDYPDLGFLFLDAIRNIKPEEHRFYLNINTGLSLCGVSKITQELAHIISQRPYPTILNGVTRIEQSVADILSKSLGVLRLDNLDQKDCPPLLQARFLSNELRSQSDQFTEISPTSAETLKQTIQNSRLSLNSIPLLPAKTAQKLIGDHDLELNALHELDQELADALGHHKGNLSLNHVEKISPTVLQALTKNPRSLSLLSLKSLPLDGLTGLRNRKNVTLKLFSLKRLSVRKAKQFAALPIKIILDSGSSLTSEILPHLVSGNARFTIKNPDSLSKEIREEILELNTSKIFIDATTELQEKLSALQKNPKSNDTIHLKYQTSFSESDATLISKSLKHIRVVFYNREILTAETTPYLSGCKCDFSFLRVGKLPDAIIEPLLEHDAVISFAEFETTIHQCRLIRDKKLKGSLEMPAYLNELTTQQIALLTSNPRVRIPQK